MTDTAACAYAGAGDLVVKAGMYGGMVLLLVGLAITGLLVFDFMVDYLRVRRRE